MPRKPGTPTKGRPDILAGVGDALARDQFREQCTHPHLRFQDFGKYLQCIDCLRRWIACLDAFDCPDFPYMNQALTPLETRHTANEPARQHQRLPPGVKV